MGLLDDVRRSIDESLTAARERASVWMGEVERTTAIARLRSDIYELRRQREISFSALGKEVYSLIESGGGGFPDESKAAKLADRIKGYTDSILRIEGEIKELEGSRIDSRAIRSFKKDLEYGGGTMREVVIGKDSPAVGKRVKDIRLPREVLLGTIVRGGGLIVPDGNTVIEEGDRVMVIGVSQGVSEVEGSLRGREERITN